MTQESVHQQAEVMTRAVDIFVERSEVRGDLWAQHSPREQYVMAQEKLNRIKYLLSLEDLTDDRKELTDRQREVLVDDALDCLNFLVFLVRLIEGKVPDVPRP